MILAGSANAVDPCRPANPRTTFAVGEPVHVGGYFSRRLLPGDAARIQVYVDGRLAADDQLELPPFGAECYSEQEPLTADEPSEWRIVVATDGTTLAEGSFSVR